MGEMVQRPWRELTTELAKDAALALAYAALLTLKWALKELGDL